MNNELIEAGFVALLFFLRHLGLIEFEVYIPKWLEDSTPEL
jgi:hypothetical protein